MNIVHEQCPNSDLNSVQVATPVQVATSHWPTQVATPRDVTTSFPPQAEQARSRPQNDVTTPSSTGQVATSILCRDLLDDPAYVATSSSFRDLNSQQARSRRQFHVATSWRLTYVATSNPCRDLPHCRSCRDIKSISRPPTLLPMSRPQK